MCLTVVELAMRDVFGPRCPPARQPLVVNVFEPWMLEPHLAVWPFLGFRSMQGSECHRDNPAESQAVEQIRVLIAIPTRMGFEFRFESSYWG